MGIENKRRKKRNKSVPLVSEESLGAKEETVVVLREETPVRSHLTGLFLVTDKNSEDGSTVFLRSLADSGDIIDPDLYNVSANRYRDFINNSLNQKPQARAVKQEPVLVDGRRRVEVVEYDLT